MKWSVSNKFYYFCLCENFVRQYDTAYYRYLPAHLEVAKKCLLAIDCFFCQIFCTLENRQLKNYVLQSACVFQVSLISQSWPRTCSRVHFNFAFFLTLLHFFLSCLRFQTSLAAVFWSFESSFFTVLAIVIRRFLYVPDYVVGSLNSLFIWSLSLQLVQYNSQRSAETRDATGLKSLPSTIQRIGKHG